MSGAITPVSGSLLPPLGTASGVSALDGQGHRFFFIGTPFTLPPPMDATLFTVDTQSGLVVNSPLLSGGSFQTIEFDPPMADLAISKTDSLDPVAAGTNLAYVVTVTNSGPSDGQNVSVGDFLPPGVSLVSTSGCAEDPAGQPTCTLGTIAAASSQQFTLTVAVDSSTFGVITNTANVTTIAADPDDGNNSADEETTVLSPPLVSATKEVSGDLANGMVIYTVTLTNNGPADQRDDPALPEFEDILPPQLALANANANSGTVGVDSSAKQVVWNGTIPAGGTVVITIEADIVEAFVGQTIIKQGTVNFDSDGDGTSESSALTDDPSQGGSAEPTGFVSVATFGIPTLSEWGFAALAFLLAAVGVRFLAQKKNEGRAGLWSN